MTWLGLPKIDLDDRCFLSSARERSLLGPQSLPWCSTALRPGPARRSPIWTSSAWASSGFWNPRPAVEDSSKNTGPACPPRSRGAEPWRRVVWVHPSIIVRLVKIRLDAACCQSRQFDPRDQRPLPFRHDSSSGAPSLGEASRSLGVPTWTVRDRACAPSIQRGRVEAVNTVAASLMELASLQCWDAQKGRNLSKYSHHHRDLSAPQRFPKNSDSHCGISLNRIPSRMHPELEGTLGCGGELVSAEA